MWCDFLMCFYFYELFSCHFMRCTGQSQKSSWGSVLLLINHLLRRRLLCRKIRVYTSGYRYKDLDLSLSGFLGLDRWSRTGSNKILLTSRSIHRPRAFRYLTFSRLHWNRSPRLYLRGHNCKGEVQKPHLYNCLC